jgi:RNA-directed DNA polymerase
VAGTSLKQLSTRLSKPATQIAVEFAQLTDFESIADLLEISPYQLYYFTHAGQRYTPLTFKKKHGGSRTIYAPTVSLKIVLKKLNQVLQAVYIPKSVTHGFIQGRGVVSNAASHSPARYLLNIDLENFFDTITFARVRAMLMAKPYSCNSIVATVLARITCYRGVLPQGSPCSPVVSNMLLGRMDSQLKVLARIHKCTYTRYADDLSFSTFLSRFPRALAQFADEESGSGLQIGVALLNVITSNGFLINQRKSRLQHSSGRQIVTGLTTNRFPNVPQEFVRQIRAMLYAWSKFGITAAADHFFKSHDYKERLPANPSKLFKRVVKGKIDYLGMVRGQESRAHLSFLEKYASLDPQYRWPSTLPPRELKLSTLETAIFAVEGNSSQGTAFNLSNVGLITCAHVIAKQPHLKVQRHGSPETFPVAIVHVDEDRDLALLKFVDAHPADLPKFEVAAESAKREDQVVLLGYPNNGPAISSSIEKGAVTGHYVRFGQPRHSISCTIYKGNSGGPVLDRNFRLIGVAANGKSKLDPIGSELFGVIPTSVLADFLEGVPKAIAVDSQA